MTLGILLALTFALASFLLSGARRVSYGLFYLAFLPFLTLDPSQGGLVTVDGISGGNVAWKLGVRAACALGVLILAWQRRAAVTAVLARKTSWPVLLLIAWAIVGLPRAQDPWISLFRLGELGVFFLTGVVLYVDRAQHARVRDVVRWHALALVPILGVAIALTQLAPEVAFHQSSAGIDRMGHKLMNSNVLGFAATVVLLWAVSALRTRALAVETQRSRSARAFVVEALAFGIAAYVLYHARSRTATLTALAALAVLWFPWPNGALRSKDARRRTRALGVVVAACLVAALIGHESIAQWFLRGASASEVATGTGRTGLWSELIARQVPEAPLLGAGYLNLSAQGGFEHAGHHWNNAHNTYLFALVATGLPGLFLVALIVLVPLATTFRATLTSAAEDRDGWTLLLAVQCVVATAGVTGFGIAGYPNVAMLVHYGLYAFTTAGARSPRLASSPTAANSLLPERKAVRDSARPLSTAPHRESFAR